MKSVIVVEMSALFRKFRIPFACCVILSLSLFYKDWKTVENIRRIKFIVFPTKYNVSFRNDSVAMNNTRGSSTVRKHRKEKVFETAQSIHCRCAPSCGPETTNTTESKTAGKCKRHKYFDSRHYLRSPDHIGRLGNLIFQVAATFGIADTLQFKPVIKSSNPILKVFSVDPAFISNIKLTNVLVVYEKQWKNESWKEDMNFVHRNISLQGFFQSWKYFSNVAECIRDLLVIRPNYLSKAKQFLKQMVFQSKTLIGVHVRRTDMMTKGSQEIGRIVASKQYITKAMTFFRTRCNNTHFIICSDDMRWSRQNINGSDVTFSSFEPAVDFAILTLCDHVIITVGTFGWWAGLFAGGSVLYLSDYPRKGSNLDLWQPKDSYYPPNWIGMNNSA